MELTEVVSTNCAKILCVINIMKFRAVHPYALLQIYMDTQVDRRNKHYS